MHLPSISTVRIRSLWAVVVDQSRNFLKSLPTPLQRQPITTLTFRQKDYGRVACRALLDQCCPDTGLISHNLANILGISIEELHLRSFIIAAGTFTTKHTNWMDNVIRLCLSQNHMFMITLMVIPEEWSCKMTYGVIIGKESMKQLDLDTSVQDEIISCGERQISMVPRLLDKRKNP